MSTASATCSTVCVAVDVNFFRSPWVRSKTAHFGGNSYAAAFPFLVQTFRPAVIRNVLFWDDYILSTIRSEIYLTYIKNFCPDFRWSVTAFLHCPHIFPSVFASMPKQSRKSFLYPEAGRPSSPTIVLPHTAHFSAARFPCIVKLTMRNEHEKYNLNFPRHFDYRNPTLFVQRLHAWALKMPSGKEESGRCGEVGVLGGQGCNLTNSL